MTRKTLLVCGIAASLLYVAATILGAMLWDGYSSTSQTVSELFAIDAPSKRVVDPLFVTYSVLWMAFGVGVWKSARQRNALRVMAIGLMGKEVEGLVVQLAFPMHLRGVASTSNDPVHGILTYIGVLFFLTAVGAGAFAFGPRFRVYSVATLLISALGGTMTGLYIPRMAESLPTPWMGVWERISIFSYLLWSVVLATRLLSEPHETVISSGS